MNQKKEIQTNIGALLQRIKIFMNGKKRGAKKLEGKIGAVLEEVISDHDMSRETPLDNHLLLAIFIQENMAQGHAYYLVPFSTDLLQTETHTGIPKFQQLLEQIYRVGKDDGDEPFVIIEEATVQHEWEPVTTYSFGSGDRGMFFKKYD